MGCCVQKQFDVETTKGEFTELLALAGYITDETCYYKLKQKFWSWTEDYTVKDGKGNDVMKIAGKFLTMRDGKTIYGPDGEKLAYFAKKILSWRRNYQVYSYKPVFEGQKSSETDADKVPVYRWAKIEKDCCAWKPCFTLYMVTETNGEEDFYPFIRGEAQCCSLKFNMKIMMHKNRPHSDGQTPIVGQLGEQTFFELGHENWGVKIAKGMDPILTIIFCIAVEDINKEDKAAANNS